MNTMKAMKALRTMKTMKAIKDLRTAIKAMAAPKAKLVRQIGWRMMVKAHKAVRWDKKWNGMMEKEKEMEMKMDMKVARLSLLLTAVAAEHGRIPFDDDEQGMSE